MTEQTTEAVEAEAQDAPEAFDVEQLIAEARPPERAITLCLRADLNAEFDDLQEQLQAAADRDSLAGEASLAGGDGSARTVAQRIEQLREQMRAHSRTIRVKALSEPEWRKLRLDHRKNDGMLDDDFPVAAVAACAVSPKMSEEQARRLFAKLGTSQANAIFNAVWQANTESVDVPKSSLASRVLAPRDFD